MGNKGYAEFRGQTRCTVEDVEMANKDQILKLINPIALPIDCVYCHAIKYKIKNHSVDKVKKL